MSENKRKICVWVPDELYSNVAKMESSGPTAVVTQGLELLSTFNKWIHETSDKSLRRDISANYYNSFLENINEYGKANYTDLLAENGELKNEIERLNEALQKTPDPVELAELRANLTGLQKLLEEKDKRIEDLTKAVDMLNVFANYFKTVNQNR